MVVVQLHNELREEGFMVVAVYPGWVATGMGRIAGDSGMKGRRQRLEVVQELQALDSVGFFNYDGTILSW